MLNYYQIDLGGNKDEKMSKRKQKKFLDSINEKYDSYVVQDILQKVRDNIQNKMDEQKNSDEEKDDFLDSLSDVDPEKDEMFPPDMNASKLPLGMNPEIERFLNWLSSVLYSSDHKVIITEDDNGDTHIHLKKIQKKGGTKK